MFKHLGEYTMTDINPDNAASNSSRTQTRATYQKPKLVQHSYWQVQTGASLPVGTTALDGEVIQ